MKKVKRRNAFLNTAPNKQIRELLNNSNATRIELAEAVGVTVEAIRLWTTGYGRPDISKLCDIAKFFDVTVDFLMGATSFTTPYIDEELSEAREEVNEIAASIAAWLESCPVT